jgi:hypothetical protein
MTGTPRAGLTSGIDQVDGGRGQWQGSPVPLVNCANNASADAAQPRRHHLANTGRSGDTGGTNARLLDTGFGEGRRRLQVTEY